MARCDTSSNGSHQDGQTAFREQRIKAKSRTKHNHIPKVKKKKKLGQHLTKRRHIYTDTHNYCFSLPAKSPQDHEPASSPQAEGLKLLILYAFIKKSQSLTEPNFRRTSTITVLKHIV
jgi:hypothetical protein